MAKKTDENQDTIDVSIDTKQLEGQITNVDDKIADNTSAMQQLTEEASQLRKERAQIYDNYNKSLQVGTGAGLEMRNITNLKDLNVKLNEINGSIALLEGKMKQKGGNTKENREDLKDLKDHKKTLEDNIRAIQEINKKLSNINADKRTKNEDNNKLEEELIRLREALKQVQVHAATNPIDMSVLDRIETNTRNTSDYQTEIEDEHLNYIEDSLDEIGNKLNDLGNAEGKEGIDDGTEDLITIVDVIETVLHEIYGNTSVMSKDIKTIIEEIRGLNNGENGGNSEGGNSADEKLVEVDAMQEEDQLLDNELATVDELDKFWGNILDTILQKNDELERENDLLDREEKTEEDIKDTTGEITEGIKDTGKAIDDNGKKTEKWYERWARSLNDNFGEPLSKLFSGPQKIFAALESLGEPWIKINDQVVQIGRSMGMNAQQVRDFNVSAMKSNYDLMGAYGKSNEEIIKYQETYANALGKTMMLNNEQKEAILANAQVIGEDNTMNGIKNFDELGASLTTAGGYLAQNTERAKMYGIDAKTASAKFAENIKLANKYQFKEGINGISKMTMLSERLHLNLSNAASVADKFDTIEKAIDTSAKLQVLGGNAAALFGNPLEMMNMAFTDAGGIFDKLVEMTRGKGSFNENTGLVEIDPLTRRLLKEQAEALGANYDEIITSVNKQAQAERIDAQLNGSIGKNSAQAEWIRNNAQYDTVNKNFYVNKYNAETGQYEKFDVSRIDQKNFQSISKNTTKEDTMYDDVHSINTSLQNYFAETKKVNSMQENLNAAKSQISTKRAEISDVFMHPADKFIEGELNDKDSLWNRDGITIAGYWSLLGASLNTIIEILRSGWSMAFGLWTATLGVLKVPKWAWKKIRGKKGSTEGASPKSSSPKSTTSTTATTEGARARTAAAKAEEAAAEKSVAEATSKSTAAKAASEEAEKKLATSTEELTVKRKLLSEAETRATKASEEAIAKKSISQSIENRLNIVNRNTTWHEGNLAFNDITAEEANASRLKIKQGTRLRGELEARATPAAREAAEATSRSEAATARVTELRNEVRIAETNHATAVTEAATKKAAAEAASKEVESATANLAVKQTAREAAEAAEKTVVENGTRAVEEGATSAGKTVIEEGTAQGVKGGWKATASKVSNFVGDRISAGKSAMKGAAVIEAAMALYDMGKTEQVRRERVAEATKVDYGTDNLMNRLQNKGSFDAQAKQDMTIGKINTEANQENAKTVGGAIGGTIGAGIGASLGSVIPVFGTVIGGAIGGAVGHWAGEKLAPHLTGKSEEEQLGKKGLAQKNFETTKIGFKNIKSESQLQQQAYVAVIAIHDLLVSKYNEDKGLLANGKEKDRGTVGNAMHSAKKFVGNLLGFAKGGVVEDGAEKIQKNNGDTTLITAKQGEMVLTQQQQARLFQIANGAETNIANGGNTIARNNTRSFNSVINRNRYGINNRSSRFNSIASNANYSNSRYGINNRSSRFNSVTSNANYSNSRYGINNRSNRFNSVASNANYSNSRYGINNRSNRFNSVASNANYSNSRYGINNRSNRFNSVLNSNSEYNASNVGFYNSMQPIETTVNPLIGLANMALAMPFSPLFGIAGLTYSLLNQKSGQNANVSPIERQLMREQYISQGLQPQQAHNIIRGQEIAKNIRINKQPFAQRTFIASNQPQQNTVPNSFNTNGTMNLNIGGQLQVSTGNGRNGIISGEDLLNNTNFLKLLHEKLDEMNSSAFNGTMIARQSTVYSKLRKV